MVKLQREEGVFTVEGNGVGDEGRPEGLRPQAYTVGHELTSAGEHPGWTVLEPDWDTA